MKATDRHIELLNLIREARLRLKISEAELKPLEDELKASFADSEELEVNGAVLATYRKYQRESLDTNKLKDEFPEIYDKFHKSTEYRRLVIKV